MVDRDARRRQHVGEDAQRLEAADALRRDRPPGHGAQVGLGPGVVERRRIEAQPVDRVPHDGLGEDLGRVIVPVVHRYSVSSVEQLAALVAVLGVRVQRRAEDAPARHQRRS